MRIQSGIPGFDKLIQGGFLKGSVNALSGQAGTGKSIFGLQFLYVGAKEFNETGAYISFEDSPDQLKEDAKVFGWDFDSLERRGKADFVYIPSYANKNIMQAIMDEIASLHAKRVVIDSMSALGMVLAPTERRKLVYMLVEQLKALDCTALVMSEIPGDQVTQTHIGKLSRSDIEEFVCDSVVTLHYNPLGKKPYRKLMVVKMKRTNHVKEFVPFEIDSTGVVIGKTKPQKRAIKKVEHKPRLKKKVIKKKIHSVKRIIKKKVKPKSKLQKKVIKKIKKATSFQAMINKRS